jgi:hypothetical protein
MTIHSKPSTSEYRKNWDQTFAKKSVEPEVQRFICLKCNYNNYLPRKFCNICGTELKQE